MKLLRLVTILSSVALFGCEAPASSSESLVGTWRLITIEAHGTDGSVTRDWGPEPLGLWFFTDTGQMSVQIVDPARSLFESGDFLRPTEDELEEAFIGYFGYFGTYTLDESAGEVVFHVEGAAYPNYIGTDQQRFYEVEGDSLTIRTPPERAGDADVTYEAKLQRQS